VNLYRVIHRSGISLYAVGIILLGAIVNCGFVYNSGSSLAVYNLRIDADTYIPLARTILSDGIRAVPISQPPGFIMYLASLQYLTEDYVRVAKYLNVALLSFTAALVYGCTRRALGNTESFIALAFVMFSPMFQAYTATLQYEVLATFLSLSCFVSVMHVLRTGESSLAIVAGLLAAVSTLVRETGMVLLIPYAACLRVHPKACRNFAAAALIPIASWILIQHHNHGVWVPISSKGGINLEIGFNPNATGTYHGTMAEPVDPRGIAFILQFPSTALELVAKKFLILWGFVNDGWNVPRRVSLWLHQVSFGFFSYGSVVGFTRWCVSLLCFAGIALAFRRKQPPPELVVAAAIIAITTAIHLAFISSARFLIPVLPFVYMFASIPVRGILSSRWSWIPCFMVLLLGVMIATKPSAGLTYTLEAENTDGINVVNRSCADCSGAAWRVASPVDTPRLISLINDQYLPRGEFELRIKGSPSSLQEPLTVIGYGFRRQIVFKTQAAVVSATPDVSSATFLLTEPMSIAIALRAAAARSYEIDLISLAQKIPS